MTAIVTRDRMIDITTPALGSSAGTYTSRDQRTAMMTLDCETMPLQSDQRAMFRSVSKDSEGKRYFTRDFSTACLPRIATASQGVAGSAKLAMDSNDDAELPGPPKSIVKKAMLFYNIGDVRKDCNRNPKGDTISFVTASRRHQEEEKCCGWIPRTP